MPGHGQIDDTAAILRALGADDEARDARAAIMDSFAALCAAPPTPFDPRAGFRAAAERPSVQGGGVAVQQAREVYEQSRRTLGHA